MGKIIFPADLWPIQRLPAVPEVALPPTDFSEDQATEFCLAMAIVALIERPNGTRRSYYGVNRAAQRRWPEKDVRIQDVEVIIPAWSIAGYAGVVDVVRAPKWEFEGRLSYHHISHDLESLAVVLVEESEIGDQEEAFLMPRFLVQRMHGKDPPWRFYRVPLGQITGPTNS